MKVNFWYIQFIDITKLSFKKKLIKLKNPF